MKLTTLLSGVLLLVPLVPVMAAVGADSGAAEPELALLFDFQGVEGNMVPDGSGHGHTGTLEAGEIVLGRPSQPCSSLARAWSRLPRCSET